MNVEELEELIDRLLPEEAEACITPWRDGTFHVELAAPIDNGFGLGRCCPTGNNTGYGWDWLDERLGIVQGSHSAQCCVCGSQSAGWKGVSADIDLAEEDWEDQVRQLADELREQVDAHHQEEALRLQRQCEEELAEVVAMLDAGDAYVVADEFGRPVRVVDGDGDELSVSEIDDGLYVDRNRLRYSLAFGDDYVEAKVPIKEEWVREKE